MDDYGFGDPHYSDKKFILTKTENLQYSEAKKLSSLYNPVRDENEFYLLCKFLLCLLYDSYEETLFDNFPQLKSAYSECRSRDKELVHFLQFLIFKTNTSTENPPRFFKHRTKAPYGGIWPFVPPKNINPLIDFLYVINDLKGLITQYPYLFLPKGIDSYSLKDNLVYLLEYLGEEPLRHWSLSRFNKIKIELAPSYLAQNTTQQLICDDNSNNISHFIRDEAFTCTYPVRTIKLGARTFCIPYLSEKLEFKKPEGSFDNSIIYISPSIYLANKIKEIEGHPVWGCPGLLLYPKDVDFSPLKNAEEIRLIIPKEEDINLSKSVWQEYCTAVPKDNFRPCIISHFKKTIEEAPSDNTSSSITPKSSSFYGVEDITPLFEDFRPSIPQNTDTDSPATSPWIIEPILAKGSITLIYAATGIGKTWFCFQLAASLSKRAYFLGKFKIAKKARVFYIDGEMGLDRCQKRSAQFSPSTPLQFSKNGSSFNFADDKSIENLKNEISTYKKETSAEKLILIFDNLTCFSDGTPTADQTTKIWKTLHKLAQTNAVILVHHEGKDGSYLGSSTLANKMDIIIHLKESEPSAITLELEKLRDAPKSEYPPFKIYRHIDKEKAHWSTLKKLPDGEDEWEIVINDLTAQGQTEEQIADTLGVCRSTVSRIKKKVKKKKEKKEE